MPAGKSTWISRLADSSGSQGILHGALYMISALFLLSAMDAVAKWLVMDNVEVMQILALRSIVIVPALFLVFFIKSDLNELKPSRPWAQMLRGTTGFIAPYAFFLGLGKVPMTDAVVVFFSSIFMVSVMSVVFLNERVGPHRWISILIGYCGVLVVVRPQGGGDLGGYALILLSSMSYALLFVSGRYLSRTESVASLVLSYNLGVGLLAVLMLPWFWVTLSAHHYLLILLLAILAVSGHFTMTTAFARSEASFVAPFEYTAVIWTVFYDIVIWNHVPGASTFVGAMIIIGSGMYVAYREYLNLPPARKPL